MSDVGYAAAVVLAVVFAWAGTAKLADRHRTATTLAALGLPRASLLGTALPIVEIALGAGLLAVPATAAYAALALLAAFTTFLVRAVGTGVPVPCGCFGSASARPVSAVEIARNLLLGAAAVVATFATGPRVPGPGAVLVALAATAIGAAALAGAGSRRRATGAVRR